jgi:hypothetical protein
MLKPGRLELHLAMIDLARIVVTTQNATSVVQPVKDILRVVERQGVAGSIIHLRTGEPPYEVTDTTTTINTAIDTLWDEWLTALGNP